jgi:hypothetical protein
VGSASSTHGFAARSGKSWSRTPRIHQAKQGQRRRAPQRARSACGRIAIGLTSRKDPGLLPQTSSELLAHESAHLLFPTGGPPDFDEWRAAIDADGPNHYGYRYVDDAIECYAVDQHEREDWANAVAMLYESARDDEAHLDELRVGPQGFRDSYPNRARIIDRLLAASSEGATSPTVEH